MTERQNNNPGISIPRWQTVLKYLYENEGKGEITASDIGFYQNVTYSHVHRISHYLENVGLISLDKQGRKNNIRLTADGRKAGAAASLLSRYSNTDVIK